MKWKQKKICIIGEKEKRSFKCGTARCMCCSEIKHKTSIFQYTHTKEDFRINSHQIRTTPPGEQFFTELQSDSFKFFCIHILHFIAPCSLSPNTSSFAESFYHPFTSVCEGVSCSMQHLFTVFNRERGLFPYDYHFAPLIIAYTQVLSISQPL